jgi:hypothetical protein
MKNKVEPNCGASNFLDRHQVIKIHKRILWTKCRTTGTAHAAALHSKFAALSSRATPGHASCKRLYAFRGRSPACSRRRGYCACVPLQHKCLHGILTCRYRNFSATRLTSKRDANPAPAAERATAVACRDMVVDMVTPTSFERCGHLIRTEQLAIAAVQCPTSHVRRWQLRELNPSPEQASERPSGGQLRPFITHAKYFATDSYLGSE